MDRVYRCYARKRTGFDVAAAGVLQDLRDNLGIMSLENVWIFNRYDTEGISDEIYERAKTTVFSEPQVDDIFDESLPEIHEKHWILEVEPLPGQYDQRADSAAQCIQILTGLERPDCASGILYVLFGDLTGEDRDKIRGYLINPVESRTASPQKPQTLHKNYPEPTPVETVGGFICAGEEELSQIIKDFGLAMDIDDLIFMRGYFRDEEKRDPTVTELKVVDTYWSDHCRHTTFGTHIDDIKIDDPEIRAAYEEYISAREEVYGEAAEARPKTLMDIATIGMKVLQKRGSLTNLDESEEINACSIRVEAVIDGKCEPWLLMFKNETHNHPTEIEPFGGAATCIGGAIRDPLSGRSYVYQAMRVTGAGDPRAPIEDTIPGKLPQKKLTVTAAEGYSSYGNQIGIPTGLVQEIYHPGYAAKRMEVGAVVGAAPVANVVRETPEPGDKIILLGGRTGRDGIGGATGSSKTHNLESLSESASEVQKGNAPEERKILRLFRKPEVTRLIKRCNDFGAGGVSVAIGELADGLMIDLSKVRKKYEGLGGTEIAISESQERMAVVVSAENAERFIKEAAAENLEAYIVAEVMATKRMVMLFEGREIANLSREFLSSNGAVKRVGAYVPLMSPENKKEPGVSSAERMKKLVGDLRFCSQRGLVERFDASVGASMVVVPHGGKYGRTPTQVMASLLPAPDGECTTASVMSFGFDPYLSEKNPFQGAVNAVVTSAAKLAAAGCDINGAYLSLQEYFERLRHDPERWGKPLSALLGALHAQLGLNVAAIGGKDSMSGSFMDMDVPPTLISFAVAPCPAEEIITPEFKEAGHYVYMFPAGDSLAATKQMWGNIREIAAFGSIRAAWAVTEGGAAEGIFKMALGNGVGFKAADNADLDVFFSPSPGSIIAELSAPVYGAMLLGHTIDEPVMELAGERIPLSELQTIWEAGLEGVFPANAGVSTPVKEIIFTGRSALAPKVKIARPKAVIPAFPGTNSEYDTARAVKRAGGEAEIVVVRNLTPAMLEETVLELEKAIKSSQMLILPGGFSGGDEPEGSGKFIAAFFRNPRIADAVHELLQKRDGLILGICNGFQALIKLGLVPYGEIRPMSSDCPTLTFNKIGRHQAKYVTTRVASVNSPWLSKCNVGDLHVLPVSHGEGRFAASEALVHELIAGGQVATQYTDENGKPSMDIAVNPNGSVMAIEGILSPDGRVFGKMAHTERRGALVAKNIYGNKHQPIFESGVEYFS